MDYLKWSKVHERVRYELTGSGIPAASPDDFDTPLSPIGLEVRGTYGDPRLIEAIAARYAVPGAGILPVAGASSGIFIAVSAVVEHGSIILVEQPVYEPIRRVAAFRHLRVLPVARTPDRRFNVSVADIQAGLGRGARAVALTNLHNPSGQLLSPETMGHIAACCADAGATLIVDEVYLDSSHLTCGGRRWTAAGVADNVIAINSLTKVYGLSGLRIGWILSHAEIIERCRVVIDLLNVDNPAPSTSIALDAFRCIGRLERRFRQWYEPGQQVFRRWLAQEPRLRGYPSCGAIFECVRLPEGVTSGALHQHLVSRYETQVVPGAFFGLDDHVRIGLVLPPAELTEALARISRALNDLSAAQSRFT